MSVQQYAKYVRGVEKWYTRHKYSGLLWSTTREAYQIRTGHKQRHCAKCGNAECLYQRRSTADSQRGQVSCNTLYYNIFRCENHECIYFCFFSFNPSKHIAAGLVFLPKLRFDFDYKVKGQVLALPLNSHGNGLFEIGKLHSYIAKEYMIHNILDSRKFGY